MYNKVIIDEEKMPVNYRFIELGSGRRVKLARIDTFVSDFSCYKDAKQPGE